METAEFFKVKRGKWNKILFNDKQIEYIIHTYSNNKDESSVTIANRFGVTYPIIKKVLKKHDIKTKDLKTFRQIYDIDEDFFETINTEEKAYWLGFLYADGVINEKENLVRINLQAGDFEHLNKFRKSISSNHPLKETTKRTEHKIYNGAYIAIKNSKMCKDLISKGCIQNKSLILKFPSQETVPKELLVYFVRGYIDGDGCITYSLKRGKTRSRKVYKISVIGTKDVITNIKSVLGVNPKIAKEKGNNYYSLYIGGNKQVEKIGDLLYKDSKVFLDRKYKKYLEMKDYVKNANTAAWNKGLKKYQY